MNRMGFVYIAVVVAGFILLVTTLAISGKSYRVNKSSADAPAVTGIQQTKIPSDCGQPCKLINQNEFSFKRTQVETYGAQAYFAQRCETKGYSRDILLENTIVRYMSLPRAEVINLFEQGYNTAQNKWAKIKVIPAGICGGVNRIINPVNPSLPETIRNKLIEKTES